MTTKNPPNYECTGIVTKEELTKLKLLPPEKVLTKKRIAFVECVESIPCDACKFSCKFDAVIKPTITAPPLIDWEKCTGCMRCVIECPGLTIFMVDGRKDKDEVIVIIPFEFVPFPKKGDEMQLLDREGKPVGKGVVTLTMDPKHNQQTGLVGITVPKKIWNDIR